jgi:ABC-type histidine transport system ATPase subunit
MNDLIIKQTHALIQAGEIAEAEANLVVIAEQEGDHALVEVLDEMAPKDVLAVMRELAHTGITMLVVTHEMGFAREVADRVIFFDHGTILEDSTPQDFFNNPAHERAKSFLTQVRHGF